MLNFEALKKSLPNIYAKYEDEEPSDLAVSGDKVTFMDNKGLVLHGVLNYHEGNWYLENIQEKAQYSFGDFVQIWELLDETSGSKFVKA